MNGVIDEVSFNTTAGNSAIVNQAVYSQNPSGTGWTGYNRTVTANYALAPDATATAARIVESTDSVNTIHGFVQSQTNYVAGNRYTISFYMKSLSANRAFIFGVGAEVIGGAVGTNYVYAKCDPDLGTIGNSIVYAAAAQTTAVTNAGDGWYRFSLSFLAANTATKGVDIQFQGGAGKNQQTYIGDGTSGVLFWGLQIEVGGTASTYQGVTTANTLIAPTWATRTVPSTVYTTGVFDEVTYSTGFAKRETQTGNLYVTGSLDEFTGAPVVDSSILWWTDGAQTASYSGSGTSIRNLANTAQTGIKYGNVTYSSVDGGNFVFSNYLDTTNNISAGNIGYPTSVNDPWTMEAWIYVPTGAVWSINNNVGPLYIRGSYVGTHGLVRMQTDNTVAVWLRGITTVLAYQTGVTTRDRWNQVVGVWTGGAGGNLQCYVNGTLTQASTTTQDDPLKSTLFYAIGASNTGMSNNTGAVFVGNISSTKLYNRALSADEVAQNFNALRRRYNI